MDFGIDKMCNVEKITTVKSIALPDGREIQALEEAIIIHFGILEMDSVMHKEMTKFHVITIAAFLSFKISLFFTTFHQILMKFIEICSHHFSTVL